METISFALGIGSVLGVLTGILVTWLTLQVKKLNKEKRDLIDQINSVEQSINYRLDGCYRKVDECHDDIFRYVGDMERRTFDEITKTNSYIDSRIDKLINNPKFCLNKEKELLVD